MATVSRSRPRVKPARFACLRHSPHLRALVLHLFRGELPSGSYHVQRLPSDFGACFRLAKFRRDRQGGQPDAYDVLVDLDEGRHSCECLGWLVHGHCKHVESLAALLNAGRLPS